ncbi:hypothetical protein D3C76_1439000 [compost metagenome]
MPASTGQTVDQLAQRRFLAVDDVDDQLEATGLALAAGEVDQVSREWRIQIVTGQIDSQHAP